MTKESIQGFKTIQITSIGETPYGICVLALCENGSLWEKIMYQTTENKPGWKCWREIRNVAQQRRENR